MEIKKHKCRTIINDIRQVVGDFSRYASDVGIKDSTTEYIRSVIAKNAVTVE